MYKIYAPSYKRSDNAKTHRYLSEVIYVIGESEQEGYGKLHDKVWIVPDSVQGNIARVRNYILDNANTDNIIMVDDDISYFGRWNGNESVKLDEHGVYNMIQEGIQLAEDMDVCLWGVNLLADKGAYREYTPLGTCQMVLGPFQAHRNNKARYDERIFLKEDYDMSIQVLNRDRKTLRMNMYHYVCDQNNMKGGCAESRNIKREMEHLSLLQKKWGNRIVRFDKSNKTNGKKKTYDINPIINVPINGV